VALFLWFCDLWVLKYQSEKSWLWGRGAPRDLNQITWDQLRRGFFDHVYEPWNLQQNCSIFMCPIQHPYLPKNLEGSPLKVIHLYPALAVCQLPLGFSKVQNTWAWHNQNVVKKGQFIFEIWNGKRLQKKDDLPAKINFLGSKILP